MAGTARRRGKLTPVEIDGRDHLTAAQAAAYLGVRVQTLYAYVSRGVLVRTTIAGQRGSFFALADVDELRARGRGPRTRGTGDRVNTQITLIGPDDTLAYRGRDVPWLVRQGVAYEDVCGLLWQLPGDGAVTGAGRAVLAGRSGDTRLAAAAVAALPAQGRAIDLLKVCVDVLGASDPARGDLRSERVVAVAGRVLAGCVTALALRAQHRDRVARAAPSDEPSDERIPGEAEPTTAPRTRLAGRLLATLGGSGGSGGSGGMVAGVAPDPEGLLEAALCLLADHDLAMSTRAARVAASGRAHPYAVIGAALGAMDSPLHGIAPRAVYRLLAEVVDDPDATIAQLIAAGETPNGYGHRVYRHRDPRADLLLELLRESAGWHPAVQATDALSEAVHDWRGAFPTTDVALATLAHVMGWRAEAGEVVFAVARMAGWVAHALEEYEAEPLRYRIEGVYSGVRPPA